MEPGPAYITSMLKVLIKPSVLRNILRCALCFGLWFGKGFVPRIDAADSVTLRWSQSRIQGRPDAMPAYQLERIFPSLKFDQPVECVAMPGKGGWMWVVELRGAIHAFQAHNAEPTLHSIVRLKETTPGVAEAYGLAFHPRFEENHQVFVCYVMGGGAEDGTRLSRFKVDLSDSPRLLMESEEILLTWKGGGHNGGCLRFGPDGMLYISTGDGSGPVPPDGLATGQDLSDLLASVLRIDVDQVTSSLAYGIPPDNPFVHTEGARPEIWAFGFRNPFKMSFESRSGDLWVGDVGWELWELVTRVRKGGNYGWSIREGSHPIQPDAVKGPGDFMDPLVEHPHSEAASITGGFHYRGSRIPEWRGAYIYGDWQTGKIWALRNEGDRVTELQELLDSSLQIVTFAENHDRELWIFDYGGGMYQLAPQDTSIKTATFPTQLSQTGLFEDTRLQRPSQGVISYRVAMEPWENGAESRRWIAVPEPIPVEIRGQSPVFPKGSVLAKTLSWPNPDGSRGIPIETQILHFDGQEWAAYAYVWNAQGSDAFLAPKEGQWLDPETPESPLKPLQSLGGPARWQVASRADCLRCHNSWNGFALGWNALQLSPHRFLDDDLPSSWEELKAAAYIKPEARPAKLPEENHDPLTYRARSYLHVNCAPCHRENAGGMVDAMLYLDKPLKQAGLLDQKPMRGALELPDARIIAPGDPFRSVLYLRMAKTGAGHMPLIGPRDVDAPALNEIFDWIISLKPSKLESNLTASVMRQVEALRDADSSQVRQKRLQALLATVPGALGVARGLDQALLDDEIANWVQTQFTELSHPMVRDVLRRFLPPGQENTAEKSLLSFQLLDADAIRGERLFHEDAALQCGSCHQVRGRGRVFGPSLDGIGSKYDRQALLGHLLHPSQWVDPAYRLLNVELRDGSSLSGMLREENQDSLLLLDVLGNTHELKQADLVERSWSSLSAMPEGLLEGRSPQEVADLMAYLRQPDAP